MLVKSKAGGESVTGVSQPEETFIPKLVVVLPVTMFL